MASAAESGNDLEACGCPAVPDVPSATALTAKLLERGLRRVAVTFVNHAGSVLAKGVPLERLPLVASQGLGFSPVSDAFGATGLIDPQQSLARPDGDLRLKPDLAALRPLDPGNGWAWAPESATSAMAPSTPWINGASVPGRRRLSPPPG